MAEVSWDDANEFADWLSSQGNGKFRLPTEAEWEYAARAGTRTKYYWGDGDGGACKYANVADRVAKKNKNNWKNWEIRKDFFNCDDGYAVSAPVGSFRPNAFGLYDMLGNVSEWCVDVYDETAYSKHSRNNPVMLNEGSDRVIRGCDWSDGVDEARVTKRMRFYSLYRGSFTGFRLAREY